MSVPSPLTTAGTPVAFLVRVAGTALASTVQVVSVETWSAVNRVPRARLVVYDGSPAAGTFELSSRDTLVPGKELEISAGYGDGAKTVLFRGVIVKQGIEIGEAGASRLVVDATDRALGMTLERRSAVFTKIKDSAVISKLIADNGLKGKVADTRVVLPDVVQYYASDWDLMVTRAELNGFVAIAEGGTVTVGPPDTSQTPVLAVRYGESVLDLQAELDASTQLASSAIRSYAWDAGTQKVAEAGPGPVRVTEPGNLSSDELAKVFGVKRYTQQTGGALEKASLEGWSSAELLKSKLSKIRGWVRFQGSARVKTGTMLELGGLGGRFNGRAYVSGVHHSIADGLWLTTADFGLSPKWFAAESPGVTAPPASGQLPAVQGLQTGIVKKVAADPGSEFRVQVDLPLVGTGKTALVWARLATFYATSKAGALFYPEVGDEVVVGFMNDDPRFAVVLGSVYSGKHPPPSTPEEKNERKAIVTRGKLQVSFDDRDGVLEIRTPKQFVRLDDKKGEVRLEDANRNRVVLSKGGIVLESAANLTLTAKGNVTVEAKGNLGLKAAATASMEGSMVSHKAKIKYAASSGGLSELKASGLMKVNGAIVKIN
jgi:Rhs element Vgr protein